MALFSKSSGLSGLLKKLQPGGTTDSAGLESVMREIAVHPELKAADLLGLVGHPSTKITDFALGQLGTRKGELSVTALLKEMVGQPAQVRRRIAELAVEADPARLSALLGPMITARQQEKREAAMDVIAAYPRWKDLLPQIKTALKDGVPSIRHEAVRLLCQAIDDDRVFLLLRNLVNDEDPQIRRLIIEAMARHPRPEIVEPFFDRLGSAGDAERSLMIQALGKIAGDGGSKIEDRLLPILADEDPKMREMAVGLLRDMPDRTRVLRAFLVHSRGLVSWLRERSTESILKVADDIVEPLLTLMQDEEQEIRAQAMVMAASMNDARIIPHAREMFLGDADWWVRSVAADVLGNFADPKVIETLLSQMEDKDIKLSVIAALGKTGNEEVLPKLMECLGDRRSSVRIEAIKALKRHQRQDVVEAIQRMVNRESNRRVLEQANLVLQSFGVSADSVTKTLQALDFAASKTPSNEAPLDLAMENDHLNQPTEAQPRE